MKRVWDEVGCEFHDFDWDWEGDSRPIDTDFALAGLDIVLGRFNGGRHLYLEVEGIDSVVAAFEEAFDIAMHVYGSLDQEAIIGVISKCSADNLLYLRQRQLEYDEEQERESEELEREQQRERTRWQDSTWHDLEKLAQAARDAGWQEVSPGDYYGIAHKRYAFYHEIGPNNEGTTLRLELGIDDSREICDELWLHESTLRTHGAGHLSCFGGWNMSPSQQYVQNIEFIDRWLGIPTPAQAIEALRQVITWNTSLGRHMACGCAGFELG